MLKINLINQLVSELFPLAAYGVLLLAVAPKVSKSARQNKCSTQSHHPRPPILPGHPRWDLFGSYVLRLFEKILSGYKFG